jgi:hypothetical protein
MRLAACIQGVPVRLAPAVVVLALIFASDAEAAPSCPDMELSTPYETPLTITLQCQDPEHPIVGYYLLGSPPTALPGNTTTYTPPAGHSGRALALAYQGTNSMGASDFGNVFVTVGAKPAPPPPPPNRPPVPNCDSYSVKPGETLSVKSPGVLDNDSDPDGDRLRVIEPYGSSSNFPGPYVPYTGSLRYTAPSKRGMWSFRYLVTDGLLQTESTITIWVGMKDGGCRPAFDPPPRSDSRRTSTMIKTSGTVRIRVGGRWRNLGGRYKLTRALLVDARQGGVRVRLVVADNYTRTVTWGRFSGGVFRLGRTLKLPKGKRQSTFNNIALVGGSGCSGGAGPGRQLRVTATYGFFFDALRMEVFPMAIRNRLVPASFTLSDRCDGSSVVQSRAGRIHVTDRGTRGTYVFTGKKTYMARH